MVNLSAAETYQVSVSSDSAGLWIGACGTASQTETVTGVAAQTLTFFLYVCTEASGTLTAELRPSGSTTSVATASRRLSVVASPDEAPADARGARGAARNVARAGTPGIVSGIHFDTVMTTSFRAKWSRPSNGGQSLTGYGILLWTGHVVNDKPDYGEATTIGVPSDFLEDGILKQGEDVQRAAVRHHPSFPHACVQPDRLRALELPGQTGRDHNKHCAAAAVRSRPASPAYDHVFGNLAEFSAGEVERGVQHGRGPADRLRDEVLALRCRESQLGDWRPDGQRRRRGRPERAGDRAGGQHGVRVENARL